MKSKRLLVISIGTFTVVSLVLALLFSSLRSYNYAGLNLLDKSKVILGVNLDNKIKNAREIVGYQYMVNDNFNIINSGNAAKLGNARVSNGVAREKAAGVYGSLVNPSRNPQNGSAYAGSEYAEGSSRSNSVATQGVNFGFYSSLSTNDRAKKINRNSDVASLTTDLTLAQNAGTKFNAGGPPPSEGDDIPPTPTLPVGDGMGYMFLLLAVFAGLKAKKLIFS